MRYANSTETATAVHALNAQEDVMSGNQVQQNWQNFANQADQAKTVGELSVGRPAPVADASPIDGLGVIGGQPVGKEITAQSTVQGDTAGTTVENWERWDNATKPAANAPYGHSRI